MNLLCLIFQYHDWQPANPRYDDFNGLRCSRCPAVEVWHRDQYTRFLNYLAKLQPEQLEPYMKREVS